jgi:hypothetical protein
MSKAEEPEIAMMSRTLFAAVHGIVLGKLSISAAYIPLIKVLTMLRSCHSPD